MKGILLSLVLVLCYFHSAQGSWDMERYHRYLSKRQRMNNCEQATPDCEQCLDKSGCSWCGMDGVFGCSPKQSCSGQTRQDSCVSPREELQETYSRENVPSFLDLSENYNPRDVVFGVNSCSARKNCSYCTNLGSCAWCEKTRSCLPHYNTSSTTEACGSDLWYKDQCIYTSKIKPCPERTSGCKECTADSVCFWCKATGNCSHYPHDGFVPDNCPAGSWYYKSCSHMKLAAVLAPILCILFIPVLIFVVLAIVVCCMRRMGYKGLDDPEEAEEEPETPPKEKRPFMMNHKPPVSKIEELRKKYNLEDK